MAIEGYYKFLPALGRLFIAIIFIISGLAKIVMPAMMIGYLNAIHAPLPSVGLALAAAIELLGSLSLVLGFKVRITALVLTFYCFATALMFHTAFSDPNQMIMFLKNVAMAGGLLQIVAFGAGGFSLDARTGVKGTTKTA